VYAETLSKIVYIVPSQHLVGVLNHILVILFICYFYIKRLCPPLSPPLPPVTGRDNDLLLLL